MNYELLTKELIENQVIIKIKKFFVTVKIQLQTNVRCALGLFRRLGQVHPIFSTKKEG